MTIHDTKLVQGAGGGGASKGGGGGGSSPNTLFSTATAKLLDLISEGEIVGVVGGNKGIFLNGTPLQNEDGTYNFQGVTTDFRVGLPDQPYMPGFPDVTSQTSVNVEVKHAVPNVQQVSEPNFDNIVVTLMVPALYFTDPKTNKAGPNAVTYTIEVKYLGGPWITAVSDVIAGKAGAPYYRDHRIGLPRNPAGNSNPWQFRVTKTVGDSTDENIDQHSLYLFSWTGIIDGKFSYPNSAYVGVAANAKLFNQALPQRAYLVDGILMPIPSNYDPVARTYTGLWDGTFKTGYTNNPAWVLNMLLINDRFGLGQYIDPTAVDKWAFYEIAQYCDQLVSTGYGDAKEPRFTYNGVLKEAKEAYEVLQTVAQAFRGMTYWSAGSVTASQNRLKDPVIVVNPSNVIDGKITYSSSAKKARHTVAMVEWINPDNSYKADVEVVQADEVDMVRYGYNPVRITAVGCTSRGQARRFGIWTLLTELREFQVATWRAGMDHAFVRPGDVAVIQDPNIADLDAGGRLRTGSTTRVLHLDHTPDFTALVSPLVFSVIMPDGSLAEQTYQSHTPQADGSCLVQLIAPLAEVPLDNAMWLLSSTMVKPQQFIVVGFKEVEPHIFEIAAVQYEPSKFPAVDDGAKFEPLPVSNFPNRVLAPVNLTAVENRYLDNGTPRQSIQFSWSPGDPFNSTGYLVSAQPPGGGLITLAETTSTSVDFLDTAPGHWEFYVAARGVTGAVSPTVMVTLEAQGWEAAAIPTITGLRVKGRGSVFVGRTCTMAWDVKYPDGVADYGAQCMVRVIDATTGLLVHQEIVAPGQTEWSYAYDVNVNEGGPRRRFRVSVAALSPNGQEGAVTSLTVANPAPDLVALTIESANGLIFASYPLPNDADLEGGLFWVSKQQGFNPLTTPPYLDTKNPSAVIPGDEGTRYYLRVAAYDAFSKDPSQLNISAEQSIVVRNSIIDVTAPEIPDQPTLTNLPLTKTADGRVTATVRVTWPPSRSENFGSYEVRARLRGSGDWTLYPAGNEQALTFENLPVNTLFEVQVRAYNESGFAYSGWSLTGSINTLANTTPPGPVTNLTAQGAFQNAFLSWVNPSDRDLKYIEIYAGATNVFANATRVATVSAPSSTWQDNTLSANGRRFYWVRPFNSSDIGAVNVTGPAQAVSAAIQAGQLATDAITSTLEAQGLEALGRVTNGVFPGVTNYKGPSTLTYQGKLYTIQNGAWRLLTAAVSAADIQGTITADQIAGIRAAQLTTQIQRTNIADAAIDTAQLNAGAVSTAKLAAGAVTTSKLLVASVNAAYNSALNSGLTGWRVHNYNTSRAPSVFLDYNWSPAGMAAVGYTTNGPTTVGSYFDLLNSRVDTNNGYLYHAVTPNTRYEASAYLSTHRCHAYVNILFLNSAGTYISEVALSQVNANYYDKSAPREAWDANGRSKGFFTPPANCTQIALDVRGVTDQGATSVDGAYVFVSGLMFTVAAAGQTEPSPYVASGATIIDGSSILTDSIGARQIVAGSITADEINANSIRTAVLVAGAIKTNMLDAGAITADKIGVGVANGNLVWNSDFNAGALNVEFYNGTANGSGFYGGTNGSGTTWQPPGMGSIQCSIGGTPAGGVMDTYYNIPLATGGFDSLIPCLANVRYEGSVYISAHRINAYVCIGFYRADRSYIGEVAGSTVSNSQGSGPLSSWARSGVFATAPGDAAFIRIWTRGVPNGGSSPYVFTTGVYLARALVNQTEFSPYAPAANTVINGGQVATNSLNANKIVAGSITTDRFTAGSIDVSIINADSLYARVITSGWVNTQNIYVASSGELLQSVFNGSAATKINGGAISANTIDVNRLKVGSRGISTVGLEFYVERDGNGNLTNVLAWTDGSILYTDDNGAPQAPYIPAGRVAFDSRYWYVWWNYRDPGRLQAAPDNWPDIKNDRNTVLMASYYKTTGVSVFYGGTIIDGTKITTRSITANQIAVNSLTADLIQANALFTQVINLGSKKNYAGRTADYGGAVILDGTTGRFYMNDWANTYARVVIGNVEPWYGRDARDFPKMGMIIWDENNEVLFGTSSGINAGKLFGQIGGNNLYMTQANIGTYMAGAAITTAYINDAAIINAKIANLQVDNAKISYLTVGNDRIADYQISSWAGSESGGNEAGVPIRLRSGKFLIHVLMSGAGGSHRLASVGINSGTLRVDAGGDTFGRRTIKEIVVPLSMIYLPSEGGNHFYTPAFGYSFFWDAYGPMNYSIYATYTGNLDNAGCAIYVTEVSK